MEPHPGRPSATTPAANVFSREAAAGVHSRPTERRRSRRQRGRDVVEQAREQRAARLARERHVAAARRARAAETAEERRRADHARSEEDGEGLERLAAREASRLVPVLRTTSRPMGCLKFDFHTVRYSP